MPITDALPDMKRDLKFFPAENENPQKLTVEQIHQFNEKGYIFPLDVFTEGRGDGKPSVFRSDCGEGKGSWLEQLFN